MQPLNDISGEEAALLAQLRECVSRIQHLISPEIRDVSSGVALLRLLRSDAGEDINQLQHAALILEAARLLQTERPETVLLNWYWHPFQTGGMDEPDLQARRGTQVVISAEATASEVPEGSIDKHMAHTLRKLQSMQGERFYFVRTESMRRRAQTKVRKASYAIAIAAIQGA